MFRIKTCNSFPFPVSYGGELVAVVYIFATFDVFINEMYCHQQLRSNKCCSWAVVVGQLVERSLMIPEVRGSNPVIGKNYINLFTVNCVLKGRK